MPHIST